MKLDVAGKGKKLTRFARKVLITELLGNKDNKCPAEIECRRTKPTRWAQKNQEKRFFVDEQHRNDRTEKSEKWVLISGKRLFKLEFDSVYSAVEQTRMILESSSEKKKMDREQTLHYANTHTHTHLLHECW